MNERMKFPVREFPQFARPFSDWWCLLCCFPEILAIESWICAKSRRNFDVLGRQISGRERGATQISDKFYKSALPSNMWQSLVTIGQATSEIRRRKKNKDLNDSGKTEWPAARITGYNKHYAQQAADNSVYYIRLHYIKLYVHNVTLQPLYSHKSGIEIERTEKF